MASTDLWGREVTHYLKQQLAVVIQRGNSVSVMGCGGWPGTLQKYGQGVASS